MKRLREANPYGPNVVIKKIECTNHVLRNYINKLRDISNKRKNSSGQCIAGCYRTILQTRLLRLRYAVTEAIKFRKGQEGNIPYEEKLKLLKSDFLNGPYHVFGEHTNCNRYFCKSQKKGKNYFNFYFMFIHLRLIHRFTVFFLSISNFDEILYNIIDEQNHVPDFKRLGIWEEIIRVRNTLIYHSESLMFSYNNNAAELYNSIVAKFVGGKRINFSKKGSYELRCNAAVTAYNSGVNRLSLLNKHVTSKSPGKFTKGFIKKYELKQCQRRRRRLFAEKVGRSNKVSAGPDANYGDLLDDYDSLENISITEYTNLKTKFLDKLKLSAYQIQTLEERTKRQHQCDEWHLERKKR